MKCDWNVGPRSANTNEHLIYCVRCDENRMELEFFRNLHDLANRECPKSPPITKPMPKLPVIENIVESKKISLRNERMRINNLIACVADLRERVNRDS